MKNIHNLNILLNCVKAASKTAKSFDEYIAIVNTLTWKNIVSEKEWTRIKTVNSVKLV